MRLILDYGLSTSNSYQNQHSLTYKISEKISPYWFKTKCASVGGVLESSYYKDIEQEISNLQDECFLEKNDCKIKYVKGENNACKVKRNGCLDSCKDTACRDLCVYEEKRCNTGAFRNICLPTKTPEPRVDCPHKENPKEFLSYLKEIFSRAYIHNFEEIKPSILKQLNEKKIDKLIKKYNEILTLQELVGEANIICASQIEKESLPSVIDKNYIWDNEEPPVLFDSSRNVGPQERVTDENIKKNPYIIFNLSKAQIHYHKQGKIGNNWFSNGIDKFSKVIQIPDMQIFKEKTFYLQKIKATYVIGALSHVGDNVLWYLFAGWLILSRWLYVITIYPFVMIIKAVYSKLKITLISFWKWLNF